MGLIGLAAPTPVRASVIAEIGNRGPKADDHASVLGVVFALVADLVEGFQGRVVLVCVESAVVAVCRRVGERRGLTAVELE